MKKYFSTVFALFSFIVLLICTTVSDVSYVSSSTLYSSVLRLHVLANSDSREDQQIKYKVRDGLLTVTQTLFEECENVEQAYEKACSYKAVLEKTAEEVVRDNNCEKSVRVEIGKEDYPKKAYGDLIFPKGEYLSVRVLIGEGKGQNWWCVLFPPLCNAGVEEGADVLVSYGINQKEVEKLKKQHKKNSVEVLGCRVKLKFLEYFE